jgi:excinuclease UvrABC helicase subunit UvrB
LRESVDLLFERNHLVTSLSQRLGEALVPFAEACRAGLRFRQSILQGADMTRRLRDLRSQQFDLLLEERRASTQISAGLIGAIG